MPVHRPRWVGYLLILLAAGLWSTSGFYAKSPIFDDWPLESRGIVLAFWRAAFAALALAFFVRRPQFRWPLLPMMGFFTVMNWLYLSAMVQVEASIAIWLQSTAPVWVFLFSVVALRERVVPRDWWMLLWSFAGTLLILLPQVGRAPAEGLIFGLASGFMYAGVVVSLRYLRNCDSAWLVFLNHLAAALVFLPFAWRTGIQPTWGQLAFLFCFGAGQMALPYLLFARGLRTIAGHEASLIGLLEPILLPLWVFLAWRSHPQYLAPDWTTLVGGGMILVGLVQRYAIHLRGPRPPAVADEPGS